MFHERWSKWSRKLFESTFRGNSICTKNRSFAFRPGIEHLEERCTPTQIMLTSSADNTLYEALNQSNQLSNALGQHFYAGETNQSAGTNLRRGVLSFDLSSVPAGSTITSATLTLHMSMTNSGAENFDLHLLQQNWGEGTSNSGSGGGNGSPATTNDVTWLDTFYDSTNPQFWTTAGGTFSSTVSATTSVNDVGFYSWTGAGLVSDVQQWVNQPSTNFGWILIGNETTAGTAKQFDTRENTTSADVPTLTVNYTPSITSVIVNQDISALYNAAGQPFAGAQRSMVNDIVYTFSQPVDILSPGADPNVFTIAVASGWTGNVPTLTWASVAGSGNTQWAVTFSGGTVTGGSIANGAYTITVNDPNSITAESDGTVLSLTDTGIGGATQSFYRLFGDINGDEFVNASDNAKFKQALTTYNAAFDFSQDGFVNASDNAKFKNDLVVNFSGFSATI
jgi:Dockerin type I domain